MGKGLFLIVVAGSFGLAAFLINDSFEVHERAGRQQQELAQNELIIEAWALQVKSLQALNAGLREQIATLQEKRQGVTDYFDETETKAGQLATSSNAESVNQWRAAAVPDAIRELYESPGCANAAAADCYKRVPTGGAMPEAGDQAGQQRPDREKP